MYISIEVQGRLRSWTQKEEHCQEAMIIPLEIS